MLVRSWPEERVQGDFIMDFQEYLDLQSRTFVQYYRCLPTSLLQMENLDEDGNWVILPPSALDHLGRFAMPSPVLFQIQHPSTGRFIHSGVLEFVGEEGFIHMPSRMMAHLGVEENELVLINTKKLRAATLVKLQPHTKDFLDVSRPKELLEFNFKKFQCLTVGETIAVMDGEKRYYLDVLQAQPAGAVCTIDTDCEVDFAPPLDLVDPPPAPAPVAGKGNVDAVVPPLFNGVAARMDGKPVEQPPVPAGRQGNQPRQPAQFTGVAARMDGKPVELPPPAPSPALAIAAARGAHKRKIQFGASTAAGNGSGNGVSKGKQGSGGGGEEQDKRFTGKPYSLKD